jgi:hypothetical protein
MENKLKQNYENACNAYLRAFCKKHGFDYEPDAWVAGEAGTVACVADYYVDMQTIIVDIDGNAPESEFAEWYDYCVRAGSLGCATPNFKSWLKVCPIRSESELKQLEDMKIKIEKIKEEFEDLIKEYNEQTD